MATRPAYFAISGKSSLGSKRRREGITGVRKAGGAVSGMRLCVSGPTVVVSFRFIFKRRLGITFLKTVNHLNTERNFEGRLGGGSWEGSGMTGTLVHGQGERSCCSNSWALMIFLALVFDLAMVVDCGDRRLEICKQEAALDETKY